MKREVQLNYNERVIFSKKEKATQKSLEDQKSWNKLYRDVMKINT